MIDSSDESKQRPKLTIEFEHEIPVVTIGRTIGDEDVRAFLEETE